MTGSELARFLSLYKQTVWSAAFCVVKNAADADDITQDVFLKLFTYNGSFVSDEHVKAWLLRCTVNRGKDVLRSHWYRFSEPIEAAYEKEYEQQTEDDRLSEAFMKLGSKNRVTLYLHYYQGYTIEETAKLLGISPSAAGLRLMRGRKQLEKLLEQERKEYDEL